jgi:hypothetical protein
MLLEQALFPLSKKNVIVTEVLHTRKLEDHRVSSKKYVRHARAHRNHILVLLYLPSYCTRYQMVAR